MIRSFMSNAGAVLGCLALSCFTCEFFEGDGGGGGAGGGAGGGDGGGKGDGKVTLSQADLDKRVKDAVDAALGDERKKTAAEKKKADEEAERKKAEEQGEHKKLYEQEKQGRATDKAASELALKRKDAEITLRDYLGEKHPTYSGVAKYIMPTVEITADMDDAAISKAIAKAADQYVKDNPRGVKGVPPRMHRDVPAGTEVPEGQEKKKPRNFAPTRRGF